MASNGLVLMNQSAAMPEMVEGVVLLIAVMYTVTNLLVDVSYAYFDPRIRFE